MSQKQGDDATILVGITNSRFADASFVVVTKVFDPSLAVISYGQRVIAIPANSVASYRITLQQAARIETDAMQWLPRAITATLFGRGSIVSEAAVLPPPNSKQSSLGAEQGREVPQKHKGPPLSGGLCGLKDSSIPGRYRMFCFSTYIAKVEP